MYHVRTVLVYPYHGLYTFFRLKSDAVLSISRRLFDLQHYKNKDSKVIVLYGMNERDGRGVAQQFVEKGFENVFLLSGGLEAFVKEFPLSVEGTLPEQSGLSEKLMATARAKSSRPPLGNSNSSNLTRGNIAKAGIETPGSSPARQLVGGAGDGIQ